ncbi:MAG: MGMT family protein [Anaerolineales bacterium]|nr:MGMT family protein [Anaerolineales bacterium]
MANCPDDVPWQRVINSQGKISERPGAERQRPLLEAEGVVFDAKGKVDLKSSVGAERTKTMCQNRQPCSKQVTETGS